MVALLRCIAVAIFAVVMFVFGCGYCLLSPRNPKHVFTFGRYFGAMSKILGVKLDLRLPEDAYKTWSTHLYCQSSEQLGFIHSLFSGNAERGDGR